MIIPVLVAPFLWNGRILGVDPAVAEIILTVEDGAGMMHHRIRHRSGPDTWVNKTDLTWGGAGVFSQDNEELLLRLLVRSVYHGETLTVIGMEPADPGETLMIPGMEIECRPTDPCPRCRQELAERHGDEDEQ
jgi:hypothetical protein